MEKLAPPDKWWQDDDYAENRVEQLQNVKRIADTLQAQASHVFSETASAPCSLCEPSGSGSLL